MSNIPAELRYTKTHEWARLDADGTVLVGITDHAQELLGDIVFVDLPEVGRQLAAQQECAVVESVKAASDIYCPVAGEIISVNEELQHHPEIINQDCYGRGWIYRVRPANAAEVAALLDAAGYAAHASTEH